MRLKLIIAQLALILTCLNSTVAQKNNETIILKGVVWDGETGVDLKARVSAFKNGEFIVLGNTDKENKLLVSVPVSSERLIFESQGYEKIVLPVSFIGDFTKKSIANFSIETSKIGVKTTVKEFVVFCYPESYEKGMRYSWHKLYPVGYREITDFTIHFTAGNSSSHERKNGFTSYGKFVIGKSDNEIIYEKEIRILQGINLIDTNIYPVENTIQAASKNGNIVENKLSPFPEPKEDIQETKFFPANFSANKVIYFKQSKYDLTTDARAILDSIATYLTKHPNKIIEVTGFTDKVGDVRLNSTLAKYRARVVSSYLKENQINESRIKQVWYSDSKELNHELANLDLSKFRKVIIVELN